MRHTERQQVHFGTDGMRCVCVCECVGRVVGVGSHCIYRLQPLSPLFALNNNNVHVLASNDFCIVFFQIRLLFMKISSLIPNKKKMKKKNKKSCVHSLIARRICISLRMASAPDTLAVCNIYIHCDTSSRRMKPHKSHERNIMCNLYMSGMAYNVQFVCTRDYECVCAVCVLCAV